jgi:hypothetical protein
MNKICIFPVGVKSRCWHFQVGSVNPRRDPERLFVFCSFIPDGLAIREESLHILGERFRLEACPLRAECHNLRILLKPMFNVDDTERQ